MTVTPPPVTRTRLVAPLIGAIAFLAFYVAVDPVSGLFGDGSLPLPGAPAAEVYAYLTANGAASMVTGVLQALSVAGLALVVGSAVPRVAGSGTDVAARRVAGITGRLAVAAMTVSAALAILLGLIAPSLTIDAAVASRTVSFLAGGVVHVVALGVLLLSLSRLTGWTRPVRVMAWIGAVPAVLSIASVFWSPLSVLLPLGRVLAMVALVTAGVSLARGRSRVVDRRR